MSISLDSEDRRQTDSGGPHFSCTRSWGLLSVSKKKTLHNLVDFVWLGKLANWLVVHQFEITPKAFANFSPGFEHRENPGTQFRIVTNPEGVRRLANPFRVQFYLIFWSQGCRCAPTPGLKLANASGVFWSNFQTETLPKKTSAAETCLLSSAHGLTFLGVGVRLTRPALVISAATNHRKTQSMQDFVWSWKHSYLLPHSRTERRLVSQHGGTTL